MVKLRQMQISDIAQVMQIEESVCDYPWTANIFRDCLLVGYEAWVLVSEKTLLGYGLLSIAANEAHVLTISIKPTHHRQGLGLQLMRHLIQIATEAKVEQLLLEVRESNHAAYKLYEQLGFTAIGIRKEYYQTKNGREDAKVLALKFLSA